MRVGFIFSRKDNSYFEAYRTSNSLDLLDAKVNNFLTDIAKRKFFKK